MGFRVNFAENMTDAMLDVVDDFEKQLEDECLLCVEKLREANRAAWIKLPSTTERGTSVLHGATMETSAIADYWYRRLVLSSQYVSNEFYEKHELWNSEVWIG